MEVTSRGGIEKVIKERKCKEVIEAFNCNETETNAAFVLRSFYLEILFKFEHVYYFQEPISSFSTKEEAVELLDNKPAKHDKGTQELKIGSLVSGIINEKLDDGYLVTINVGSKKFQGVFYNDPQAETSSRNCKKNFTTEALVAAATEAYMTKVAAVATTEGAATKVAVAAMTKAAMTDATTKAAAADAVTAAETDASTTTETDAVAIVTATATENEAAETDAAATEAEISH